VPNRSIEERQKIGMMKQVNRFLGDTELFAPSFPVPVVIVRFRF